MEDDTSTIVTTRPIETSVTGEPSLESSNFLEWGPVEIENWLNKAGFEHDVISKFTVNNIVGETLPYLNDEHFNEMEIDLKEKVRLKVEINKLITENGFIKSDQNELKLILKSINELIQSNMDTAVRSLNEELHRFKEDLNSSARYIQKPLPTPDKNTHPSSPFNLSSPTKQTSKSPNTSEAHLQRKTSDFKSSKSNRNSLFQPSSSASSSSSNLTSGSSLTLQPHTNSPNSPTKRNPSSQSIPTQSQLQSLQPAQPQPVSEPLKQLRASTDDPCSKILQAAMKRHKLNDADWRDYALVICYGDKERILELDEKPVMIFKELKERGEHPAIMLRQRADYDINSATATISQTPGGKL